MIFYEDAKFHPRLLFKIRGSVFHFSILVAVPAAALSVLLKFASIRSAEELNWDILGLADSGTVLGVAWSSVSSLLGFLVVFRTSQAYARFWEGCHAMYQMLGEWFDSASSLVAFCKRSRADKKDILIFQHTLVRLISLLNAVVLMDLSLGSGERQGGAANMRAFELELIDAEGIDKQSLQLINEVEDKVELIFQWVQQLIVEAEDSQIFSVSAPILSRAFHELAQGMVRYQDASKIARVPLPFPYMQTMEVLLVFHWLVCPFLTCMWVQAPVWAGVLTFMQVFFLWSLNCIAAELENPFGDDVNDLPAEALQLDMNRRLLLLLRPGTQRTARLSDKASFDEHEDLANPSKARLGAKVGYGKNGVGGFASEGSLSAMNRRISLGALQESIQDETQVELEIPETYESESAGLPAANRSDKRIPTATLSEASSLGLTSRGDKKRITYTLREVSKSSNHTHVKSARSPNLGYVSPNRVYASRDFEEQVLSNAEALGGRLMELVQICEEMRDRMQTLGCGELREYMRQASPQEGDVGGSVCPTSLSAGGACGKPLLPPVGTQMPGKPVMTVPAAARPPNPVLAARPRDQGPPKELICCASAKPRPSQQIRTED